MRLTPETLGWTISTYYWGGPILPQCDVDASDPGVNDLHILLGKDQYYHSVMLTPETLGWTISTYYWGGPILPQCDVDASDPRGGRSLHTTGEGPILPQCDVDASDPRGGRSLHTTGEDQYYHNLMLMPQSFGVDDLYILLGRTNTTTI